MLDFLKRLLIGKRVPLFVVPRACGVNITKSDDNCVIITANKDSAEKVRLLGWVNPKSFPKSKKGQ